MATAFIGLGSNLGDRISNIQKAIEQLNRREGIAVTKISSIYETAPIGLTEQPDFLNAVAEVETSLKALDLLHVALDVENDMGRIRNLRWGPRVIDIDLLIYDDLQTAEPELTLPHPRMRERAFVLIPLSEIAPDLRFPDGEVLADALKRLDDQHVRRRTEIIACNFLDTK